MTHVLEVLPLTQAGGCLQTLPWARGNGEPSLLGRSSALLLEEMPRAQLGFPPCRIFFLLLLLFSLFLEGRK